MRCARRRKGQWGALWSLHPWILCFAGSGCVGACFVAAPNVVMVSSSLSSSSWHSPSSFWIPGHHHWKKRQDGSRCQTKHHDETKDKTTTPPNKKLLIFGYGNVAQVVAKCALQRSNYFTDVFVTVRRTPQQEQQEETGETPKILQFEDTAAIQQALLECTHVLVTIPPTFVGDPNATTTTTEPPNVSLYRDALLDDGPTIAAAIVEGPRLWMGLVSTTSVYGNYDGAWVTEESPPQCGAFTKAAAYWDMERRWSQLVGGRICIFRCAGLYGVVDAVAAASSAIHTVVRQPADHGNDEDETTDSTTTNPRSNAIPYTCRIHLQDVGRAIVASMTRHPPKGVEIYNLADEEPAPRAQVMKHAAHLIQQYQLQPLPLSTKTKTTTPQPGRGSRRRGMDRKRVQNSKMKSQLVGDLLYPTYREGLQQVVDAWIAEQERQQQH